MSIKSGLAGLLFAACAALAGCAEMISNTNEVPRDPVPVRPPDTEQPATTFQGHHEQCADLFARTMGFGQGRMMIRTHGQPDYPRSLHLSAVAADPEAGIVSRPAMPWLMDRIELVGLLNQDKPVVYLAEARAQGKERLFASHQKGKPRELDDFERGALAQLRVGEQVRINETDTEVRLLGAIRARADCKKCHDQPEGTLLGAFSYVFVPAVARPPVPGEAP